MKLEKAAQIILKVQESLVAAQYFLAISPETRKDGKKVTHPLNKILGYVKLRLA